MSFFTTGETQELHWRAGQQLGLGLFSADAVGSPAAPSHCVGVEMTEQWRG